MQDHLASLNPLSAYLLVTHGSRDPRHHQALNILADYVRKYLDQSRLVATATLECNQLTLGEQIVTLIKENKLKKLIILPLFLLAGVHVKEDIPEQINFAYYHLDQEIQLEIKPYLGSYLSLEKLFAKQLPKTPNQGLIFISHGSRLAHSNQLIETLALNLKAITAYWSTTPNLETQINQLLKQGYRNITIIPYFLFAGGITDAIANQIQDFQKQFPDRNFLLGKPLGATPELAQFIVEEMLKY